MRALLTLGLLVGIGARPAVCDCKADGRDRAVLEKVLSELVAPRLKAGEVLLEEVSAEPGLPATRQQAEAVRACGYGPECGKYITDAFKVPRGVDLELEAGRLISRPMVDSLFSRVGCPLPELQVGDRRVTWLAKDASDSDPVRFWRRIRRRHKVFGAVIALTLPGYSPDGREAIVSYTRLHGGLEGRQEAVYLRRVVGEWTIAWSVVLMIF